MSILGTNALVQLALPSGWDATELARMNLGSSNITYETVVRDIASALNLKGTMLMNDPLYGTLFRTTTNYAVRYRGGAIGGMQERTEYQKADARRASSVGGMLPIKGWDRGLGWTYEFLRKADQSVIDDDVSEALNDVEDNWQRQLLRRFFSNADNLIGTAGYDLPFANAGTNVIYTPPASNGVAFASTHTHFERLATGAQATAFNNGAAHLREHGHSGPYMAIVPSADVATYTALAKFIRPDRGVQYLQTGASAPYGVSLMPEAFVGMYESDYGLISIWSNTRLPTNYLGIYKSYGVNDTRNPLAVRYDPDQGSGPVLLSGDTMRKFPLEYAVIWHDFGVGVNDRLAGYAAYFAAAGNYVAPTIG